MRNNIILFFKILSHIFYLMIITTLIFTIFNKTNLSDLSLYVYNPNLSYSENFVDYILEVVTFIIGWTIFFTASLGFLTSIKIQFKNKEKYKIKDIFKVNV